MCFYWNKKKVVTSELKVLSSLFHRSAQKIAEPSNSDVTFQAHSAATGLTFLIPTSSWCARFRPATFGNCKPYSSKTGTHNFLLYSRPYSNFFTCVRAIYRACNPLF